MRRNPCYDAAGRFRFETLGVLVAPRRAMAAQRHGRCRARIRSWNVSLGADKVTPNIKLGGRIMRAITGTLCIGVGAAVLLGGWIESPVIGWVVAILAIAAGGFQLFEAKNAWCVMRAKGFKTPM